MFMEEYVYGTKSDKKISIIVKPLYYGVKYTLEFDNKEDFDRMRGGPEYMSLANLAKMTPRIDKKNRKYCFDIKFMTAQEIREQGVFKEYAKPWVKIVLNPNYEELAINVINQLEEQIAEIEKKNTSLHKIESVLGK